MDYRGGAQAFAFPRTRHKVGCRQSHSDKFPNHEKHGRSMREILIVGRGGQGAQTAGNLLAQAFFSAGQYVQSFATYGGARRGTPVSSVIRVDAKPIRLRCDVTQADALLCFDASLLDQSLLDRTRPEGVIVVNTVRTPGDFSVTGRRQVFTVDGYKLAAAHGLGRFINSALLRAL